MGCGGSKESEESKKQQQKKERGMEGVGPNDGSPTSRNPLTPPREKETTPPGSEKKPVRDRESRERTKDIVNKNCDSDDDIMNGDRSGSTSPNKQKHQDDHTAHYEDSAVSGVVGAPGAKKPTMATFCFGDNTDAKTLEECDDAEGDIMTEGQMKKRGSKVRREGVSAEPILPDAAEKFEPRVIEKSDTVREDIRKLAVQNPLFRDLEGDELQTVISAMEEEVFKKDDEILKEGEMGTNKFYFIAEGSVSITRGGEFICAFHAGKTFGELELMYLSTCAATVTATSDKLVTFSLDSSTYRHIVMFVSIRKRKLYMELLQGVGFLSTMGEYDRLQLADALETTTFEEGQSVITFGEKADWMYIIVTGNVKVVGRDENTKEKVEVCTFTAGDCVGELEFLNHHNAVADVIATETTKTCRLHRDHFEMCMGPVVDYLKENALTDKYSYYNSVVTEDDDGNKLSHFKFGDAEDDATGGAFTAFADGPGMDSSNGPSEEADADDDAATRKKRGRAHGVSDEVMDDDEDWTAPVYEKSDDESELLMKVLKTNLLLRGLEGNDLQTVVAAMEKRNFPSEELILEQHGEGGTHYFVITSGVVEILKNGELVCTFSDGEGFGEMELMYIQPCVATVKARTDVETWALDRGTYKRLVQSIAVKRRQLYTELLGGVEFLENMSEYERGVLADALTPATFPPGTNIIRRGERNEWMHIIVDGVVDVFGVDTEADDEGKMKHVCILERGACVGELEFLNQHPAVADCIAKTEVKTCTLHRDHFEMCMGPIMDVLRKTVRQDKYQYYNEQLEDLAFGGGSDAAGKSPGLSRQKSTLGGLRRRGRAKAVSAEATTEELHDYDPPVVPKSKEQLDTLQKIVRKCPLFSALQSEDRAIIIGALEEVTMKKDEVIIQEGEIKDENHWYIVSEGEVVTKKDDEDEVLATYHDGMSFGELELMYTTAAQATTLVTSDTVTLFRLDRRSYQKIVMKVCNERRELYKELMSGIQFLAQLSESEQLVLADALSPVHFTPGEFMIKVGQHNDWMYILVDGVVEVFGKDSSKICDLRRGEMVGELEFLHKHAAVANCVAKTHVQACRLHRDHFEMCMGSVTDFIEQTLLKPKYSYYNARRASMQKGEDE